MQTFQDLRDHYIARVVEGKSFVDVGGLWGVVNEKVSVAYKYGANSVAMLDVTPKDTKLWHEFYARMQKLDITDYQTISADICDSGNLQHITSFDVVHCSGVLYHHPHPMLLLVALHNLTREISILTSAITQQFIENERGKYTIPPSGVLFVPALNDEEFAILKPYWTKIANSAFGLTEKAPYRVDDFGPWWWLPTAPALEAMCKSVGFNILDTGLTWGGNALTLLLKKETSVDRNGD